MLADLCERIPGGDVDIVSDALGTDSRIGRKYLTGSLGYGGPCFPRDNVALSYLARTLDTKADLAETTDVYNRSMADRIIKNLRATIKPGMTVAVLGLAYKPLSHVVEESPGVYLAEALSRSGARVVAFDPLANESAESVFNGSIVILDSIEKCLKQSEVVLITTSDNEFKKLKTEDFQNEFEKITVVDFWRILPGEFRNNERFNYIAVGTSKNESENVERLKKLWNSSANAAV